MTNSGEELKEIGHRYLSCFPTSSFSTNNNYIVLFQQLQEVLPLSSYWQRSSCFQHFLNSRSKQKTISNNTEAVLDSEQTNILISLQIHCLPSNLVASFYLPTAFSKLHSLHALLISILLWKKNKSHFDYQQIEETELQKNDRKLYSFDHFNQKRDYEALYEYDSIMNSTCIRYCC